MKRKKVSRRASKKVFAKSANRPHPRNIKLTPSRGGIRLGIAIAIMLGILCTGCRLSIKDFTQSIGSLEGEIVK